MILDKFRLNEKVAVVTGGTKGIGKAIALALAEAGADIVVISRSPHEEIEQSVLSLGRRYVHQAADLTKREETKAVIPAAALYLASPASDYVHGTILTGDGG